MSIQVTSIWMDVWMDRWMNGWITHLWYWTDMWKHSNCCWCDVMDPFLLQIRNLYLQFFLYKPYCMGGKHLKKFPSRHTARQWQLIFQALGTLPISVGGIMDIILCRF